MQAAALSTPTPVSTMDRVFARRLVPVLTLDNATDALWVAEAFAEAGLDVMEITLRTPAALECLRAVRREYPGFCLGAGTLLDAEQVAAAVDAGAAFGVAPGVNESVILAAHDRGLPFVPGVATPSEIERALMLSCPVLKLFPAEPIGGLPYLKAVAAPYAHTGVRFIPLGGITPDLAPGYLRHPQVAAIGGSWLVTAADFQARDRSVLVGRARDALALAAG
jgi:2-dehydro-3-deoxyphosphogluconate aldolase/(4S)-4-hydroxy-2-oxoglutarate aldolase